jgi:hypothetical protein
MAPPRDFEDKLRAALGKAIPGTRTGGIAFQKLSDRLWDVAREDLALQQKAETDHDVALTHQRLARELHDGARRMVQLLIGKQQTIREAFARGYLRPPSDLANLAALWWMLMRLSDEADRWGREAERHARALRPTGPGRASPAVIARRDVTGFVKLCLAESNIALERSETGTFARVLKLVHAEAGVPRRHVYRDICWALDNTESGLDPKLSTQLAAARTAGARTRRRINYTKRVRKTH